MAIAQIMLSLWSGGRSVFRSLRDSSRLPGRIRAEVVIEAAKSRCRWGVDEGRRWRSRRFKGSCHFGKDKFLTRARAVI
jgi:hypothetical protein